VATKLPTNEDGAVARGDHDGTRHHDSRSAVVNTAVVAITTTPASGAAVKASTASASNRNDQTVLRSIAAKRHPLDGNC
jgi:hypothetical protein